MGNKYGLVLSKEDLNRIHIKETNVRVDLHGLKVRQAKILVKNLIALENREFTLDIIHGYNHGTALKEMLSNTLLSSRISHIEGVKNNLGESILYVSKASA